MRQRTRIKRRCCFHTFNACFADVVILLKVIVEVDEIINVITIAGYAPAHACRQAFKRPFPLLALFRIKMGIAVEAIELTQIRRFIGRTIRGYEAVTVNELPGCATLPGTMATKLRVVIAAGCRLQSEIAKLLQPGQVDAGVTQVIGVGDVVGTRLGALFLPVNARADIAMPHVNRVGPLNIVLFDFIQGSRGVIASKVRIVIVVFAVTVAGEQL
ncbi:Uncharacterised protein [Enterobacter cloacae]|nr:Uncharacterised protein [Enterobacter cloacae]